MSEGILSALLIRECFAERIKFEPSISVEYSKCKGKILVMQNRIGQKKPKVHHNAIVNKRNRNKFDGA
jgi:hypothetical protein